MSGSSANKANDTAPIVKKIHFTTVSTRRSLLVRGWGIATITMPGRATHRKPPPRGPQASQGRQNSATVDRRPMPQIAERR